MSKEKITPQTIKEKTKQLSDRQLQEEILLSQLAGNRELKSVKENLQFYTVLIIIGFIIAIISILVNAAS